MSAAVSPVLLVVFSWSECFTCSSKRNGTVYAHGGEDTSCIHSCQKNGSQQKNGGREQNASKKKGCASFFLISGVEPCDKLTASEYNTDNRQRADGQEIADRAPGKGPDGGPEQKKQSCGKNQRIRFLWVDRCTFSGWK